MKEADVAYRVSSDAEEQLRQMPNRLTTAQVEDFTGVPQATLRYWRHKGTGPASYTLGRRVVYDAADVVAWVEAQKKATVVGGVK